MKKYQKPKTRTISANAETIMTSWSQMYTGGGDCGKVPEMGTDCKQNRMLWEGL